MILVLQTTVGTRPESDAAIQQVITRYGLRLQEPAVSYGVDTFSYYHVDGGHDVKVLIGELMRLRLYQTLGRSTHVIFVFPHT